MGNVVCMRCGIIIRVSPTIPGTSHGLCARHAAQMRKEIDIAYPPKKKKKKK